jgi:glycosyltransferase involved in cell wall biosynthesis
LLSMTGKLRYKVLNENLGFAGGVNQGLMMSRGETILILNNDTVVTKRWLTNMLSCLNSHPNIGLIGPMTNYISGDQWMQTDYHSIREMQKFANSFNIPDPGRWRTTQRLTGLCVLMKRDVFRRIGYFDEGFIIGNCEDDDYGFRVRLSGLDLIIAGDTFIHHYGSTSIKSLESSMFKDIYNRNQIYYGSKWGDTEPLRQEALSHWDGIALRMNDFYPAHVAVKGPGPTVYWIENGLRHPIFANMGIQATRLAQVDLRNLPVGVSCTHTEIQQKMDASSIGRLSDGSLLDGVIVKTDDGHKYQYKQGKFHRIANDGVLTAWFLNARPIFPVTEMEKNNYPEGLPIIAPPMIKSNNI